MTTSSAHQPDPGALPDAVLGVVASRLRARGERMTRPRKAVVSALAAQTRHVTAEELVEAVALVDARVHRASVYRSLETLTALGVVQHIHVGHGPTAYHLIGSVGVHPHAQCRSCGALVDLPAEVLDDVAARMRVATGFVLDGTHMALSGQCARCADIC
jgi:Fur family ferric uptake transcriptional regulator